MAFGAVTVVMVNIQALSNVTLCRLVNSYRRFKDTAFRNVRSYLPVDTASNRERRVSSAW